MSSSALAHVGTDNTDVTQSNIECPTADQEQPMSGKNHLELNNNPAVAAETLKERLMKQESQSHYDQRVPINDSQASPTSTTDSQANPISANGSQAASSCSSEADNEEQCFAESLPSSDCKQEAAQPTNETDSDLAKRKLPTDSEGEQEQDPSYWEKRRKNNESAKRSREARRMKEEATRYTADLLLVENERLKQEREDIQEEIRMLRQALATYK